MPRDEYDRLKAILHDAARNGPAAANRDGRPQFRAHLEGRISWVRAANPARGDKLDRAFAANVPYLVNVITDVNAPYPRNTFGI